MLPWQEVNYFSNTGLQVLYNSWAWKANCKFLSFCVLNLGFTRIPWILNFNKMPSQINITWVWHNNAHIQYKKNPSSHIFNNLPTTNPTPTNPPWKLFLHYGRYLLGVLNISAKPESSIWVSNWKMSESRIWYIMSQ